MANTLIQLDNIATTTLAFLMRRRTLSNRIWNDVTQAEHNQNESDTIKVRTPPSFTAEDYDGVTITPQDITEGSVDVILDEDVIVPSQWSLVEASARAGQESMDALVNIPAADALLRQLEAGVSDEMRVAFQAAGREFGGLNDTTYGDPLEVKDIAIAEEELDNFDVDPMDRHLAIDGVSKRNLQQKNTFLDASASGRDTLSTGELGIVYGFDVFGSNDVIVNTGPDPDETYNLFFQRTVAAIAFKNNWVLDSNEGVGFGTANHMGLSILVTKSWDFDTQAHQVVFRLKWGLAMLDTNRGGILRG